MIRASKHPPPIIMEEITDPDEIAKARALRDRFNRNFAWLQAHADDGFFVHDIPRQKMARIYATRWRVVAVR
jgi:hypothetical protein